MNVSWSGDNSKWMISEIIPKLDLSPADKIVMKWAYMSGVEMQSDGETGVEDDFMGGMIKSPAGVTHDYINRVPDHRTPDDRVWSVWSCNALFYRIKAAQWKMETARKMKHGDINAITRAIRWQRGFRQRVGRWLGVTLSSPLWWQ